MEKKDVRINLVISPSELARLDDSRARRHIWSRSDAIRRLIAEGLARWHEEDEKEPPEKPS